MTKNKFGKIQSFSLNFFLKPGQSLSQMARTVSHDREWRELAGVTLSLCRVERHLNGVKGSQAELTVSQNLHNGEVMMTDNSSRLWLPCNVTSVSHSPLMTLNNLTQRPPQPSHYLWLTVAGAGCGVGCGVGCDPSGALGAGYSWYCLWRGWLLVGQGQWVRLDWDQGD